MTEKKGAYYINGLKMGIPIGIGYLAVSFSLGITAKNAGLTGFQAALTSLLLNASAGEYAAFALIAVNAGYFEIALMEFVANARYLLMSCALSQKLSDKAGILHRMIIGVAVTDEMFGVSMSRLDKISPFFYFGMMSVAMPCWSLGTYLGVVVGNVLPVNVVSALSVGLYGMFLASIIPPARKNRIILAIVAVSMFLSLVFSLLPLLSQLSEGVRTIILTVVIASAAAILFPVKEEEDER